MRTLVPALMGLLALAGDADAQSGKQYYGYPAAGPLTGAEIIGPIRQSASDRAVTVSNLLAGMGLLVPPSYNVGLAGATTAPGTYAGHSAIGNNVSGTDAFVGIRGDEFYTNPAQEMRGVSYQLRQARSTPDIEPLGWDMIPLTGSTLVDSTNTQFIQGNMKAVVGELHFMAPGTGVYTVHNSYNFQAAMPDLGTGVTVSYWQGLIVNTPGTGGTSGGAITNGYGIEINPIIATNQAAIKLDGTGTQGRIWWPDISLMEDASSHNLDFMNGTTVYWSWGAGTVTETAYQPSQTMIDTNAANKGTRQQSANGSLLYLADNTGGGTYTQIASLSPAGIYTAQQVLLAPLTVATLPACVPALSGALASITDATAPTYNAALTGGGTIHIPVFCNGASWSAH